MPYIRGISVAQKMKFSLNWYHAFCVQYKLAYCRNRGSKKIIAVQIIEEGRAQMLAVAASFSPENIWNADEVI